MWSCLSDSLRVFVILQSHGKVSNNDSNTESAKCLPCEEGPETKEYFTLKCKILTSIRESILNEIDSLCLVHYRKSFYELEVYVQSQLVLDSSKAHKLISNDENTDFFVAN